MPPTAALLPLVLLVTACGAPSGSTSTSTASPLPALGYAAYLRRDGPDTVPWLVPLDGSGARNLGPRITGNEVVVFEASPDGRTVAYVSGVSGEQLYLQLYDVVADTMTDVAVPLTGAGAPTLTWLSDSSALLFFFDALDATGTRFVRIDGSPVETLSGPLVSLSSGTAYPSSSPYDAAFWLRLHTGRPDNIEKPRIYDQNADFTELTGTAVIQGSWGPGAFVFIEQPGDAKLTQVVRFDLVTKTVVPLTSSGTVITQVVADPTGRHVAYGERRPGKVPDMDWYRVDLDAGGAPLPLTDQTVPRGANLFAWSPTGDHGMVVEQEYPGDPRVVASVTVVDEVGDRTDASPGDARGAAIGSYGWSPDGRYLAFSSFALGPDAASRAFVYDTAPGGGTLQLLDVSSEDRPLTVLAWSPDGSSLLVTADSGPTKALLAWDVGGGTAETRLVASDVAPIYGNRAAAFTDDGAAVVWIEQGPSGTGVHVTEMNDPSTSTVISSEAGISDADEIKALQVR